MSAPCFHQHRSGRPGRCVVSEAVARACITYVNKRILFLVSSGVQVEGALVSSHGVGLQGDKAWCEEKPPGWGAPPGLLHSGRLFALQPYPKALPQIKAALVSTSFSFQDRIPHAGWQTCGVGKRLSVCTAGRFQVTTLANHY